MMNATFWIACHMFIASLKSEDFFAAFHWPQISGLTLEFTTSLQFAGCLCLSMIGFSFSGVNLLPQCLFAISASCGFTFLTKFFLTIEWVMMVVIISMNADRATFRKFAFLTNFLCRWQFIIGNRCPRVTHLFHGSLAWQAVVITLPYCPCACQYLTRLTECFAVPVEQNYTQWVACRWAL